MESDLRNAEVCYCCGEQWTHANNHNHLCSICRFELDLKEPKIKEHETKGMMEAISKSEIEFIIHCVPASTISIIIMDTKDGKEYVIFSTDNNRQFLLVL